MNDHLKQHAMMDEAIASATMAEEEKTEQCKLTSDVVKLNEQCHFCTPANEWREERIEETLEEIEGHIRKIGLHGGTFSQKAHPEIGQVIRTLLDQHSARLVERLQDMAIVDDYGEKRKILFQIAKDQAIDIIKDNK